jgi:serine/threonine protein kinase
MNCHFFRPRRTPFIACPEGRCSGPDDNRAADTLGYMAPEQFTTPETVDHRADIYSTVIVLYEMLAGELPEANSPPPSQKAATNAWLDPIVMRATERVRERRYQAAWDLHSEITATEKQPTSY